MLPEPIVGDSAVVRTSQLPEGRHRLKISLLADDRVVARTWAPVEIGRRA